MSWISRLLDSKGKVIHKGFVGKYPYTNKPLYTAHLTLAEQKRVEREFNPKIDYCQMDTIYRLRLTDQQRR